ncbi:hypothetical protein V8D89_004354 [Ganoderma adspersum]
MSQIPHEHRREIAHWIIAPEFVKNVVSLNSTAEPETGDTKVMDRWTGHCKEYDRMLNASEAAAITVASLIRLYISIQNGACANPPLNTKLTARQLSVLKEKLGTLTIDQTPDFERLIEALKVTGAEIDRLFEDRVAQAATTEYESARAGQAVTTTTQDELRNLGEYDERGGELRRAALQPFDLFSVIAHIYYIFPWIKRRCSEFLWELILNNQQQIDVPDQRHVVQQRKLLETKTAVDELKRNQQWIRDALQNVCKDLQTQAELLRAVFSEVTSELAKQSDEYLEALSRVHTESSPVDQLAFPNARHRFLSTSGAWKERATTLIDEYAKRMK